MEPGKTCGVCEFCKSGRYNLCKDVKIFARRRLTVYFKNTWHMKPGLCFLLPRSSKYIGGSIDRTAGSGNACGESGKCPFGSDSSCNRSGMYRSYDSIVIKSNGGITDYVVDIIEKRLQKALEVGATAVINGKEENTVERMMQLTEAEGLIWE